MFAGYECFDVVDGLAVLQSLDVNNAEDNFSKNDFLVFDNLYSKFRENLKYLSNNNFNLPGVVSKHFKDLNVNIEDDSFLQKIFIRTLIQQASNSQISKFIEPYIYDFNFIPSFNDLILKCSLSGVNSNEIREFSNTFGNLYERSRYNILTFSDVPKGISNIDVTLENMILNKNVNVYTEVDPLVSKNVPLGGFVEEINGPAYDLRETNLVYFSALKVCNEFLNIEDNLTYNNLVNIGMTAGNWRCVNSIKIGSFRLIQGGLEYALDSMNIKGFR